MRKQFYLLAVASLTLPAAPARAEYRVGYLTRGTGARLCVIPPPPASYPAPLVSERVISSGISAPVAVDGMTTTERFRLLRVVATPTHLMVTVRKAPAKEIGPLTQPKMTRLKDLEGWLQQLKKEVENLAALLGRDPWTPGTGRLFKGGDRQVLDALAAGMPDFIFDQAAQELVRTAREIESGDASSEEQRNTAREELRKDFLELRRQLEQATGTKEPLRGDAGERIAARLAEVLPVPIEDTLFYHYGLRRAAFTGTAGRAVVEIHPGMRLRLEHTFRPLDDGAGGQLNYRGFVMTGNTEYQAVRRAGPAPEGRAEALDLNAFLGELVRRGMGFSLAAPGSGIKKEPRIAGSILDYHALDNPRGSEPHLAVIYPDTLPNSSELLSAVGGFGDTPRLIRANNLAALETALTASSSTPNDQYLSILFRGRGAIIPEVQVFVNQTPTYVPVGTKLGDLLDASGNGSTTHLIQGVRLIRTVDSSSHLTVFSSPDTAHLELPLLKGDRIQW